jgi:asparagine synthase (glutamine-hydrolysing)
VPPEILARGKHGFGVPLAAWFHDGLDTALRERVLDPASMRHGYFDRAYVETLLHLYATTARPSYLQRLWALLVFDVWHRAYVHSGP